MTVKDEKQAVDADGTEGTATNPRLSKGAKEALRLAFDPAGGPVQDIVLREMARYAGAAAAELASSAASGPASVVVSLAEAQQAAANAMGAARPPVPTALELFAPLTAAARQTESDRETLRVAAELASSPPAPRGPRAGRTTRVRGRPRRGWTFPSSERCPCRECRRFPWTQSC